MMMMMHPPPPLYLPLHGRLLVVLVVVALDILVLVDLVNTV